MAVTEETIRRTEAIFRMADRLFRMGCFEEFDSVIADIDIGEFDSFACRSWLVASKWAADKLPSRPSFRERVVAKLMVLVGEPRATKLIANL